jgi:hypothetical protein
MGDGFGVFCIQFFGRAEKGFSILLWNVKKATSFTSKSDKLNFLIACGIPC